MKTSLFILLLSAFASTVKAQTFDEWFKQKKTQKKYLIQQIAALKVYTGYLQKGYLIARNGLNTISNIKNGELHLHDAFFNSLMNVNPNIRNVTKVSDIIRMQVKIVQTYNRSVKHAQASNGFCNDEIRYIKRVYSRLINDCTATIDELITVITDNKLTMKDDERIKRIDALYEEMQDNYSFTKSFSSQTMMLASARIQETNDIQNSRKLSGLSPTP